jgi:hypothetical protein
LLIYLECPVTPFTCAYLTRYYDVAADFNKEDYPELKDIATVISDTE